MLIRVHTSPLKIISLSGVILAIVVVALALGSGPRKPALLAEGVAPQTSIPSFTLTTSRTVTDSKERAQLVSTEQRFQRSDGIYKLVQTLYAHDDKKEHVQILFGYSGLGVFRLDEGQKRLVFMGPLTDDRPADIERFLRADEQFTREEAVAGINAIVWRKSGRAKGDVIEEFRAPSLGGLLVKIVKTTGQGREVLEPTAIQMGEPEFGLFSELLSYQVDYSAYEEQVRETEKNEPDVGVVMRQLLVRMQRSRPS